MTIENIEALCTAIHTQERHEQAHPERDIVRLLSDALMIEKVDTAQSQPSEIRSVLRPFITTLGRAVFLRLVEIVKNDDGATYEPILEHQVKYYLRMFL